MTFKEAKKLKKRLKKNDSDGDFEIVVHKNGCFYVIEFLVEKDMYSLLDNKSVSIVTNSKCFTVLKNQK